MSAKLAGALILGVPLVCGRLGGAAPPAARRCLCLLLALIVVAVGYLALTRCHRRYRAKLMGGQFSAAG